MNENELYIVKDYKSYNPIAPELVSILDNFLKIVIMNIFTNLIISVYMILNLQKILKMK